MTQAGIGNLVASINSADDMHCLADCCEQAARAAGYHHYSVFQPAMSGGIGSGLVLTNYPNEWLRRSARNLAYLDSPVIMLAARSPMPFQWSELPERMRLTCSQQAYLRQIRAIGMVSGFTMPVHRPTEVPGFVSFVDHELVCLGEQETAAATYVCLLLFNRARQLRDRSGPVLVIADPATREIAKLMLRGRSLRFIADRTRLPVAEVNQRIDTFRDQLPLGSNIELLARVLYPAQKRGRHATADILAGGPQVARNVAA